MRTKIAIGFAVLILAFFNVDIFQHESLKESGTTIFLKLSPFIERSLLQGDFLRLQFSIERHIPELSAEHTRRHGDIVIKPNNDGVGEFVRVYRGGDLQPNEKLMHFYQTKLSTSHILPNVYFIQEDTPQHYQHAKYAIFKFDDDNDYLLVGLADKHKKPILPR